MLIPRKENIPSITLNFDLTMQSGYNISNEIDGSALSYFITFSDNGICDNATVSLSACQDGVCSHYFNVSSSPCSFSTNDVAVSVFATNIFGNSLRSSAIVEG